jgi:CubicO group peptidase (beta-lactamase class C family)
MRGLLAVLTVSLIVCCCSHDRTETGIDQRIAGIENGLTEFKTPLAALQGDSTNTQGIRTLAERMEHYKVPGVSIAVINDYTLEWAKAYGVLRQGSVEAVTTDSYFQAASTSKLVTAAVVLHLAEKGLLDFDEDVNSYLRSWRIPENDFTRQQKVTLRLLLTHQAGLPTSNFSQQQDAPDPTLVQILKGELPAINNAAVVEYTPGTKWQYSNLGYVVIQQILEDLLGKPFPLIAQEILFEQLGMEKSTFVYPLTPGARAAEAMPHDAEGVTCEPAMTPTASAHGGLMTTPSDLAVFVVELMRAYHGRSNRLFAEEMARRMFRKELDLDPRMLGVPLGMGLGSLLYGADESLVFLHPGSNLPGMTCWLSGQPATGKGAVIMTNGAMGEVLAMEIASAIVREYDWTADTTAEDD